MSDVTGIMLSVNPPYAGMLLSGYKPFEFRKAVMYALRPDTLKHSGPMTVFIYETIGKGGIGAVVGEVQADYTLAPLFLKGKDEQDIRRMYGDLLSHYWRLFSDGENNSNAEPSSAFLAYLKEIGARSEEYNYAVHMSNPIRYAEPVPIGQFYGSDGKPLKWPPQNMCLATKPGQERSF